MEQLERKLRFANPTETRDCNFRSAIPWSKELAELPQLGFTAGEARIPLEWDHPFCVHGFQRSAERRYNDQKVHTLRTWGVVRASYRICDLLPESVDGVRLSFSVNKRHEYTENSQETVGPVFFLRSLSLFGPFEPLLDTEL